MQKKPRGGKLPLLVITGDEDPLFSPEYYTQHLSAPLRAPTLKRLIDHRWVRLPYGDHALCRYRREVVQHVVRFALKCVGMSPRVNLFRLARLGLSWRGPLLDPVVVMMVLSVVTGFMGGQFCATPEGKQVVRQHHAMLQQQRHQAIEDPDVEFKY